MYNPHGDLGHHVHTIPRPLLANHCASGLVENCRDREHLTHHQLGQTCEMTFGNPLSTCKAPRSILGSC